MVATGLSVQYRVRGRPYRTDRSWAVLADEIWLDRAGDLDAILMEAIAGLPNLTTFIALGKVAHDSLCRSFSLSPSKARFAHGAVHRISDDLRLVDSYHCSRYNQNTRRLDVAMFEAVFERALGLNVLG